MIWIRQAGQQARTTGEEIGGTGYEDKASHRDKDGNSGLGAGGGLGLGPESRIIENTRNTMNGVRDKRAAASNAALGRWSKIRAPTATQYAPLAVKKQQESTSSAAADAGKGYIVQRAPSERESNPPIEGVESTASGCKELT